MKTSPQLDRFTQYVDKSIIDSIYQKADALSGLHILHFNTTATGGGVAEILSAITPVAEEFGIRQTRRIIELDDASNRYLSPGQTADPSGAASSGGSNGSYG
jgi:trehalose synthase